MKRSFKNILAPAKRKRVISLAAVYAVLIGVGFVYLYPIRYMLVNGFFSREDLLDPSVIWIPTEISFDNFAAAFNTLDFFRSFFNSVLLSAVPALLQTAVTAVVGFGLARFKFPLKRLLIILIISTFLLPAQIMMVPRYVLFDSMNITETIWAQYLPAMFGQGIKSAIFILVFYQYFSSYPKALDEAAGLDGAGKIKTFLLVALPMATGAIVLSLLFSFVWYWNETYQSNLLFGSAIQTLPLKLQSFTAQYEAIYGGNADSTINESISLAGTLLSIIPVIILYICLQKQFVESIERSGITGE